MVSQRNWSIHLDSDLSIIIRRCKSGCLNAFLMSSVTQRDNRRMKPFRWSQQWARGLGGVHAASRVAVYLPTACALHACGRSFLGIWVCICQSVYSLTVCVHAERHCECRRWRDGNGKASEQSNHLLTARHDWKYAKYNQRNRDGYSPLACGMAETLASILKRNPTDFYEQN